MFFDKVCLVLDSLKKSVETKAMFIIQSKHAEAKSTYTTSVVKVQQHIFIGVLLFLKLFGWLENLFFVFMILGSGLLLEWFLRRMRTVGDLLW